MAKQAVIVKYSMKPGSMDSPNLARLQDHHRSRIFLTQAVRPDPRGHLDKK
jgi:hypothetical protein